MNLAQPAAAPDRLRVRVRGTVQGVGFRPFVYGLANRFGLSGFVLNDAEGVLAEIEGLASDLFLMALRQEHPPLARIETIDVTSLPLDGENGFEIRPSANAGEGKTKIVPDTATCERCLAELFDPASRFHLYPFITCTHCGPRFTITRSVPYDRSTTSMDEFGLCAACAQEYRDPGSRRFHAETIACSVCGPRLSHPWEEIANAIQRGEIIAIKGLGGFQLFCDATNESVVALLRARKCRPDKPFAIMVGNESSLEQVCAPTPEELVLLRGAARPIVLVRATQELAASVAPKLSRIGVMLPSAPVHFLLFHALAARSTDHVGNPERRPVVLVATSANFGGEPLVITNPDAMRDLASIADMIVTHDRVIVARADDSVMAVIDGAPAFIRRSRGFVPEPIDLGQDGPSVLAVGAQLKTTVCVTRGREAFVSQHVGDLGTARTIGFYDEAIKGMLEMLGVAPEIVACDLHPDYRSTLFAEATGLPILRVQHHAAHLAAVAAEHHLHGRIVGIALDGHGQGEQGGSWGGELMLLDGARWGRYGHLRPLPLPGGDRAAREPWRMGVAALTVLERGNEAAARFPEIPLAGRVASLLSTANSGPATTSMGRLFDAAAALLGVCTHQTFEGQAAIELEALVRVPKPLPKGYRITNHVLDFRPLLMTLTEPGVAAREGAELFHGTLIAGLAQWAGELADQLGLTDVVLGGGCLANRILAGGLASALRARGLAPWLPRAVPANDGGISLGQAAMARAYLMTGSARARISGR